MERNSNQTHISVSASSGSASEQPPSSDGSTDRKEVNSPSDGHSGSQPFSQEQQQRPAHRYQHPDAPPPRWARALVRLILESSSP